MSTCVNMHRISRDFNQRNQIMEHASARPKDVPIRAAHMIATFTTVNGGKIKRAMNTSIQVGEMDKSMKGKKSVMLNVSLQSI